MTATLLYLLLFLLTADITLLGLGVVVGALMSDAQRRQHIADDFVNLWGDDETR